MVFLEQIKAVITCYVPFRLKFLEFMKMYLTADEILRIFVVFF